MELSSFVGRRHELAELRRRLSSARLLTLIGPGGVGKTRLAQRLAAERRRAFRDGVWFVGLADVRDAELPTTELHDPQMLAQLIAVVLGLQEGSARSPLDHLAGFLASHRLLLVLDNCEHVPAVPTVVATLLRNCPRLRILATSREMLMVDGEHLFEVPPLSIPPTGRRGGEQYESVVLFVSRARSFDPGFELSGATADAVAGICRRLDGLPLAIELAAGRLRALTSQQILDRLSDPFALLGTGPKGGPVRQQTLRACLDWSFELCSRPEQILWARLAVFTGSFDLDDVEGVVADDDLPAADLLDLIGSLVDKSVLVRAQDGPTARYRMLQTVREYGYAALRGSGEEVALRRRHRDWYEDLVVRAGADWIGPRQAYWLNRLAQEEPNLTAAVDFCLTVPDDVEAALRMALALPSYWWLQGRLTGGLRWLERALGKATESTPLRARALLLMAYLALLHGDLTTGITLASRGRALAEQLAEPLALAEAGHVGGVAALYQGDFPVAVDRFERALRLVSTDPDAQLDLKLSLLMGLAVAAEMVGDSSRAAACQDQMLAATAPRGECCYRSRAMWRAGMAQWRAGDLDGAATLAADAIRLRRAHGLNDWYNTALGMELLAWVAARQRRHRRAAVLLGAADVFWTDLDIKIGSRRQFSGYHDDCYGNVKAELGETAFGVAWHHGRSLSGPDAIGYALDELSRSPRRPAEPNPTPLTRREKQVANLVPDGMSNAEIAQALVISRRTAESHVANIMVKLGFTSRAQIARWVVEQGQPLGEPAGGQPSG